MRRARGVTLVEILVSLALVGLGVVGLFRVLVASAQGVAAAQHMTEAQSRAVQIIEAIRTAPTPVLDCLATTPTANWPVCETLCMAALGVQAQAQACVFVTLGASTPNPGGQSVDGNGQQYAVAIDTTLPSRSTSVTKSGATNRIYDTAITIGWNDDGSNGWSNPGGHRVTVREALYR